MKTKTPLTVVVRMASDYDEGTRASASWVVEPDRFHIWFDVEKNAIEPAILGGQPVIYKNPVESGRYRTRYLDASAQEHVETIREVFATIEREGLVAKAKAERDERERVRRAKVAAERREQRIKEAGLQLAEAVRALLPWAQATWNGKAMVNPDQIAAVTAAQKLLTDLGVEAS